jgi:hypothetical protein
MVEYPHYLTLPNYKDTWYYSQVIGEEFGTVNTSGGKGANPTLSLEGICYVYVRQKVLPILNKVM